MADYCQKGSCFGRANPTRRSWPNAAGINQADDIEEIGTPKK
jgi:hypothetical protein